MLWMSSLGFAEEVRSPQNRASYPYFFGWLVRKGYLSGRLSRDVTREYDQAIDNVVNQ